MMRFTIRDLLLLTVIAALAAGWLIDHRRLKDQVAKLKTDAQMRRAFDDLR